MDIITGVKRLAPFLSLRSRLALYMKKKNEMEIRVRVQEYIELERLGLDIEKAKEIAPGCNSIRELEYKLYFDARKIH